MMKSVKFLAALCIAAMLVSCAKDEYVAQDQTQQRDEYVGADLLGTDVSMTVGFGTDTKIINKDWESTDLLGLGWLVKAGDFANAQTGKKLVETDNKLYANHMYSYVGNGKFTSKGNIYEGWHYAYFPYEYAKLAGQPKMVTVNPTQKLKGLAASRNEMLHLSGAAFLTQKNNLDGAMNLVGVDYTLEPAFSVIGITVNPSETFTGSETLQKSKITGISLKVDGKTTMFANEVEIQGSELDDLASVARGKTAKQELLSTFDGVLNVTKSADTVYTKVENPEITLAGAQELRFFVKPGSQDFDVDNVTITVYVEGGKFIIEHRDSDDDDYSAINNAAIASLVEAYAIDGSKTGALTDVFGGTVGVRGLSLNLELTEDMFTVDFGSITTASEWNQAVNIANDLGKTSVLFNLDGKIEIEEGVELQLPDATTFIVKTAQNAVNAGVYIGTDYTMTKKMASVLSGTYGDPEVDKNNLVVVKEGATLTLVADDKSTSSTNEAAILNVKNLTNAGTINLGYHSTVKNLYNDNGRVNVVYGSYVEDIKSDNKGVIAYVATGNDSANDLNDLMKPSSQDRYATINTIVVNEGVTFSLATARKDDGEYGNATTLDSDLIKLMTVEMNGGKVVNGTVKTLKVESGDNNIISNVFATDLIVNGGAVKVESEAVNGLIRDIQFNYITNNATLIANTDIYTVELTTNANSNTYAENGSIYYNNKTRQNGFLYGIVTDSPYGNNTTSLPGVVKVYTDKALVNAINATSNENGSTYPTYANIKLGADITLPKSNSNPVSGSSYNVLLQNGVTLDGCGYSINTPIADNKVNDYNTGNDNDASVFIVNGTTATVKNLTFASKNTRFDILVANGSVLNIEKCNFTTATNSAMKNSSGQYLGKRAIYVTGSANLNVVGGEFDDRVYAFNGGGATSNFTFKDVTLKGWMSGHGTHTFINCTFAKSGTNQNYVAWGDGQTATFRGCTFNEGFALSVDGRQGTDTAPAFIFDNKCKVGYVTVETPENILWDLSGGNTSMNKNKVVYVQFANFAADGTISGTPVNYYGTANEDDIKHGETTDTIKLSWSTTAPTTPQP